MNNKGKNFITIMVIIAISAVLLRVITVRVIERNTAQNKSSALGTIKLIATALENYAKDSKGLYPVSFQSLTETKPPYLDIDYITQSPVKGYTYSCSRLEPSGYNCSAAPTICKVTGSAAFTITTGALLVSEECDKKE
ncbi:MAG: hypothetical protein AABY28_02845 [Candidatus Omnitrophota bacterium]